MVNVQRICYVNINIKLFVTRRIRGNDGRVCRRHNNTAKEILRQVTEVRGAAGEMGISGRHVATANQWQNIAVTYLHT